MKKSELSQSVALQFPGIPEADIQQGVSLIFEVMANHLATHKDRIEIRGFGSFSVRHHKKRKARNPKTGETVIAKATHRPRFKAGKELREKVGARNLSSKQPAQL